ncbi:uncharacterized protein LOC116772403 isoform X1 [Danaus plexippus]|uniref:uncharacterized protein LOC116772403 isoform X1 n=1 Tax=Danaus plexippus TaxID=13037 RepID=UPI002AB1A0C5|nr:uncharacterized protein LOC116772403 isoform X1 [Danaus plexippus]
MKIENEEKSIIYHKIKTLQKIAFDKGIENVLNTQFNCDVTHKSGHILYNKTLISVSVAFISLLVASSVIEYLLSARCLLPINHLVWEATRPLADCGYCENVTKPLILWNVTRYSFKKYAYSSKPIIVKNAIKHWSASKFFSINFFKTLYEQTPQSYESLENGCQFLNFKSDLFTLKEVFEMPKARVSNQFGQEPWYVGWGNCHPTILSKVREYYSIPEFLPDDAEFPATENIFIGYEMGAVMHLDYIPRLMWQGQVKGNKTWLIKPVPECENSCSEIKFYVEPGDVVLLDTRLWYHSTTIPKGQLSLTVQSEYG